MKSVNNTIQSVKAHISEIDIFLSSSLDHLRCCHFSTEDLAIYGTATICPGTAEFFLHYNRLNRTVGYCNKHIQVYSFGFRVRNYDEAIIHHVLSL